MWSRRQISPRPARAGCSHGSCWPSSITCWPPGSGRPLVRACSARSFAVYRLEPFSAEDVQVARTVIERYADQGISLADASITVIATRHSTQDVLTLDERHFRILTANGKPFRLLPADA